MFMLYYFYVYVVLYYVYIILSLCCIMLCLCIMLIILQQNLPQVMKQVIARLLNSKIEQVTLLLVFLSLAINTMYLLSILIIFIKKLKVLLLSRIRIYYYTVMFYIVSKLAIAIYLLVTILIGFSNEWVDITQDRIQILFKNSLVLADLSLIQLFLLSFEYYISICFSLLSPQKFSTLFKLLIKIFQVSTFFVLLGLLITFDIDELINYYILNVTCMSLNFLSIFIFLFSFFYLNFQMTGVMIQGSVNELIKKVYKMVLILLVSRSFMFGSQLIILLEIKNESFSNFLISLEQGHNQYIILGACFILYILFILLTEGIPIMISLRNSVILAYNMNPESTSALRQSILSSTTSVIIEPLLDTSQQSIDHKEEDLNQTIELKSFKIHSIIPSQTSIWTVMETTKGSKQYILRQIKSEISNYVMEEIESEIQKVEDLSLKNLNKIRFFKENDCTYIFQKLRPISFDEMLDKTNSIGDQLRLALKIALTISELHQKDIVHGCLKAANIRFDHNEQVYLLGYGLQSLKKFLSLTMDYTNKTFYTAIQIINDRNHVILRPKKPSDIYSFGMLLYEIVTKNKKYRSLTLKDIKQKFGAENIRPKIPQSIDDNVANLMRKCWQEDPFERPTISYVIDVLKRLTG